MAEEYGYDVHLLIPRVWESYWFQEKQVFKSQEEHSHNFHIHPMATTSVKNWGRYFFLSLDVKLRSIKPDLIYILHEESSWVHHQIYLYRKLWCSKAKIIFFSMNARGIRTERFYHRLMWKDIKENTEAALVHYPGCLESLRAGGYEKPVYMQTQIGVDEDMFCPDEGKRKHIREQLGVKGKFVIGYAGRLIEDKGLDDLISILPLEGVDWALLLVGDGSMRQEIEDLQQNSPWGERIILTGSVSMDEVPSYMRAMDCFVLASKTMPHWIDTFPLVSVQAQACGVPVIGSDSGAIPWQLGESALLFPEGDRESFKARVRAYALDEGLRLGYAEAGRLRSLENFCTRRMTKNFHYVVQQVMRQEFAYHEIGEEHLQWKAY
ncbi:glycosyltransferase family 4 protein [Spiribacter pallidus]|uniref:Glycosyltransferase family 4 protein n=1 Tax=Spiribacter pallidus TaxID=1987936 RepID=A0ABV3TCN1_9GAMM